MALVLSEIRNILSHNGKKPFHLGPGTRLGEQFDFVLGACLGLFSILKEKLDKSTESGSNAARQLPFMEKLELAWNHQEMRELLRNI